MRPILPLLVLSFSVMAPAASVDGTPIHSTVRGSGPETIVFVHGWTCDESSWTNQVPFFEKNYRVITLDLPGHGQSGSPANGVLTMELFAKAIEAVRTWRFKPAVGPSGTPVATITPIEVNFRLL